MKLVTGCDHCTYFFTRQPLQDSANLVSGTALSKTACSGCSVIPQSQTQCVVSEISP